MKSSLDRYLHATAWTTHIFSEVPFDHSETVPLNEKLLAFWAVGILIFMSRHISDVDVIETGATGNLIRFFEGLYLS